MEQKQDKPRICEVLGVEVGEKFTFTYPHREYETVSVHEDGTVWEYQERYNKAHRVGHNALCWLINHPECIIHQPRLTESELAILRAFPEVKWVSRDENNTVSVALWRYKPKSVETGFWCENINSWMATVDDRIFPSIRPGDCICVEGLT